MNIVNFIDTNVHEVINILKSTNMTKIMMIISYLGSASVFIIISLTALILIKKKKYPILIIINLINVFLLNRLLKVIFRRNRPPIFSIIKENGYSFPSGHSMVAMGFYGFLIYIIYKKIKKKKVKNSMITLLSILIILIGISRIYLGVHYATDVFGGFLFGLIYLIIFIKYISKKGCIKIKKS